MENFSTSRNIYFLNKVTAVLIKFNRDLEEILGNDSLELNNETARQIETLLRTQDQTFKDIISYLNLSILSGEYLLPPVEKRLEKFIVILNEIENSFSFLVEQPINEVINIQESIEEQDQTSSNLNTEGQSNIHESLFVDQLNEKASIVKPLELAISFYRRLVNISKDFLTNTHDLILIHGDQKHEKLKKEAEEFHSVYKDPLELLDINITFARIDHTLSTLHNKDLKELRKELYKLEEDRFITVGVEKEIIQDKGKLLIYKLLYRRYSSDETTAITSRIDNKKKKESINSFKPKKYFLKFQQKCKQHYPRTRFNSTHSERLSTEAQNILDSGTEYVNLSFEKLHVLTRYYKKDRNHIEIENIYKACSDKKKLCRPKGFDIKAYNTNLNYFFNNFTSIKISEIETLDIEKIKCFKKEIDQLHSLTKTQNYFPYLKLAKQLSFNISQLLKQEKLKSELKEQETTHEAIQLLEKILIDLDKKYAWSRDHYFDDYQLPYEECFTIPKNVTLREGETTEEDTIIELFVASSFILPIPYQKLPNEIEKLKDEKALYKQQLRTIISITNELNTITKIQSEVQGFKTEMKEESKRVIERFGLFTAVIALVIGSTSILTNVKDVPEALLFLLTFAGSISFMGLILTISIEPKIYNRKVIMTGAGILISVISLISLHFIKEKQIYTDRYKITKDGKSITIEKSKEAFKLTGDKETYYVVSDSIINYMKKLQFELDSIKKNTPHIHY